jgi:hypothetical protein
MGFVMVTESDLLRDIVTGTARILPLFVDWVQLLFYKRLVKIWPDVHIVFLVEDELFKFINIEPRWNGDLDLVL